jgi:methionyl-tRNA synthetase
MTSTYITTTIPYVNARPHLGFALELVQADVLARHRRAAGEQVRFQAGTDDNSLKNVLAAQAAGVAVQEFVDANAAAFTGLARPLSLSVDDLIRTSSDPRHRPGVERLWRACAARGDLYRRHYEGLYCVGCEQFYTDAELAGGRCPEHGTLPEPVSEVNWFFRLSRYAGQLRGLITDGAIRVEPAERRNEVLALIDGGLTDFSVSRSTERARGWGIPVPEDPDQVIYVWWDALSNYLAALDYASDGANLDRWWSGAARRIHLLGKGVLRFHAVYWPAMLLSAGEAVPTDIVVHGYLTDGGRKISKSSGAPGLVGTVDPYALVDRYGTDAVRWWLLREVPRGADADFTVGRLVGRADDELANGFGNLVNRVVSMIHRYRDGQVPAAPAPAPDSTAPGSAALDAAIGNAPSLIAAALADFDFRRATEAVWRIADEANRHVNRTRPWALAKAGDDAELATVLAALLAACQAIGTHLAPFLPDAAARITRQCAPDESGYLPRPSPLLPRIALVAAELGAPAELRRILVVEELLDRHQPKRSARLAKLAPGERPGHHRGIAHRVPVVGGARDHEQRPAGGNRHVQCGQGAAAHRTVQRLDGVGLHDQVERSGPVGGQGKQVGGHVRDLTAGVLPDGPLDRRRRDVERGHPIPQPRQELRVVAKAAADDQGPLPGPVAALVGRPGPLGQVRVGVPVCPRDDRAAPLGLGVQQLEPAGLVRGADRVRGKLPGPAPGRVLFVDSHSPRGYARARGGVNEPSGSAGEHQVGESKQSPVHAHVLPLPGVEPLADLGRARMAGVGDQPLLPPSAERGLEVVPFPLVGLADVDDPPAAGAAGLEEFRQAAQVVAEDAEGSLGRWPGPERIAEQQPAAGLDDLRESAQRFAGPAERVRRAGAQDPVRGLPPSRRVRFEEGDVGV